MNELDTAETMLKRVFKAAKILASANPQDGDESKTAENSAKNQRPDELQYCEGEQPKHR
ncbi:MAG: hypothetical protein IT320_17215 [Anaerolineae bacterium]|jgi:hypothetical protein|nr:hypothetical protein [Anaerolineae bacterium]